MVEGNRGTTSHTHSCKVTREKQNSKHVCLCLCIIETNARSFKLKKWKGTREKKGEEKVIPIKNGVYMVYK